MDKLKKVSRSFSNLDPKDPSNWPFLPKCLLIIVVGVFIFFLFWWCIWSEQEQMLEAHKNKEQELRTTWEMKEQLAMNFQPLATQLEEIKKQFGTLLKQLPNKTEVDGLLSDINQSGLGRGLHFELFKPEAEKLNDFFADKSISLIVTGSYKSLGYFVEDISKLHRIVVLGDLSLKPVANNSEELSLQVTAHTFRYLEANENSQPKKNGTRSN